MTTLQARCKQYDIPAVPYLPMAKNVLIYRIPEEEKTAGGLYVPEVARDTKDKGILLAAGLTARDVLADHLIELGDMVWFGRFAGSEREVSREDGAKGRKILQVKVEDVLGSVDALERVMAYAIVRDENGEHRYMSNAAFNDNYSGPEMQKRQANGKGTR